MSNKILWIVLAVVIIVGGIYLITGSPGTDTSETGTNPVATSTSNQNQVATNGRVVFSVSDAAANMSAISDINIGVTSVEMHSTANGWVTVSSTPRTFNLLTLNATNKSNLLADINAKAGTYDQVRLTVSSITVKMKDGTSKAAKLPSGMLKIDTTVVVNANNTASVNFDFLASKSLHTTGNGSYIFAPVIKTETKSNAKVGVNADNSVAITGGHVESSNSVGMDLDGSVKANFEINSGTKIDLNTDGSINLKGLLK